VRPHQPESELSSLLADLQEETVLEEVRRRIGEGDDLLTIVEECRKGVRLVGERYEQGVYYISGLIMASAIMHEVGDMILPALKTRIVGSESGRILLGTVEGDIHYIGKDITKVLLRCYGFTVFDLGVDVPSREFLAKALDFRPAIVGLSCLLDSALENMRATIDLLRREAGQGGAVPSFIIGGYVDDRVCRYVAADVWATDAMNGVRLCQQLTRGQAGGVRPG
jgi:methanogenic corrinoid protein MtbC1